MTSILSESPRTTPGGRRIQKFLWASLAASIPGYYASGIIDSNQPYVHRLAAGCLLYQAILLLLSFRERRDELDDSEEHKHPTTDPLEHPPLPYVCRKLFIILPCVFTVGWIVSLGLNAAMVARIHTAGLEVGLWGVSMMLTVISVENMVAFGALAILCAKERRRLMDVGGLVL